MTVPYAPDQNGINKRINRTLIKRVQSVLYGKNLDKTLWAKIANTVIYLKNRSPTTVLQGKTPYKAWYGQKLDLSYLRILGCIAHLHVPKETGKKLDSHTKRCILVGYSATNIYKLWNPEKSMVIQGQGIVFDKGIQQLEPPTTIELEELAVIINLLLTTHLQASSTEMAMATNFSITTDTDQVGAQPATDKPIEPAEQTSQPVRQLLQTSQPVQQLLQQSEQSTKGTFSLGAMLAQEVEVQHVKAFGDEPCSYQEEINSLEQDLWEEAMRDELLSLKANNT